MVKYLVLLLITFSAHYYGQTKNIPKVHVVEIKDMKFIPEVLEVRKGDQVLWINRDMVIHNVTNKNGGWASPSIPPEKSWKKTVQTTTAYYCSLHPVMTGKVVAK
jgi:plastocyanin